MGNLSFALHSSPNTLTSIVSTEQLTFTEPQYNNLKTWTDVVVSDFLNWNEMLKLHFGGHVNIDFSPEKG